MSIQGILAPTCCLGPRGLAETATMLQGLKQAVQDGQITPEQIDASVTRILALKLHYKIITHP